jgi:hypothetical protein
VIFGTVLTDAENLCPELAGIREMLNRFRFRGLEFHARAVRLNGAQGSYSLVQTPDDGSWSLRQEFVKSYDAGERCRLFERLTASSH